LSYVDSEADTVSDGEPMSPGYSPTTPVYSPPTPVYSPPPPSYIEADDDSGVDASLPEEARIDSVMNRELIMEAIRLLEVYTRTERGRGRGRPTQRVRDQQHRRLDLLAESLETLR
jgi:hypothetical protein